MTDIREQLRGNYGAFALAVHPDWGYTYFQQEVLAPLIEGISKHDTKYRRTIINLPFRHAKSEFCVETGIAYYLGVNPKNKVILLSYGKTIARKSGRAIREIMRTPQYAEIFPEVQIARHSSAADEFMIDGGGGFFAGGFDTGVNGRGAHCVAEGQRVLTENGWVPIESIRVGVRVATPHGWQRIRASICNGVRETISIGCGDKVLRVTDDHRILTPTGWVAAGNLRLGDVVYGTNTHLPAVQKGIRRPRKQNYQTPPILFSGMLKESHEHSVAGEASELQSLWKEDQKRQQGVLLSALPNTLGKRHRYITHTGEHTMSGVCYDVSPALFTDDILFVGMQEQCTRGTDEWSEQSEFHRWRVDNVLSTPLQETPVEAASVAVQDVLRMQYATESSMPSCRREQAKRYDNEYRSPVSTVSYAVSQIEKCGPARVYDIEVEEDHCFCAEGIFVHNCLVIDDPHKSRAEVASETIMNTLYEMYNNVVRTRLEPGASILITTTRWSPTDLVGWRLQEDPDNFWHVVKMPAEAEVDEGWRNNVCACGLKDANGKLVDHGERLWPERFSCAELYEIKLSDQIVWESSYQQAPTVLGGLLFADTQPMFYEEVKSDEMNRYMLVDPALATDKKANYTAIIVVGLGKDGNIYWLDLLRERFNNPGERAEAIFRMHRKWRPIRVGYEEYGLTADVVTLQKKMEEENYRFALISLGRKGAWHNLSKTDRIATLVPLARNGKLWLPNPATRGRDPKVVDDVNYFLTKEWARYPASKYDDVLDVFSRINDPDMSTAYPKPKENREDHYNRRPGATWMSL